MYLYELFNTIFWIAVIAGFIWLIVRGQRKRGQGQSLIEYGLKNKILTPEQVQMIESHRLKQLVEEGFVTESQAKKIAPWMYEEKSAKKAAVVRKETVERNVGSAIHKIAYFAVGCVVLGIISLIAANWENIPDAVKLAGGFGALFATLLGTASYYDKPKKEKVFELMVFGSIGLILANIGLVGQIFHLGGTMQQALWAWALLSTPLFWISRARASTTVWWILILILSIVNFENKWIPLFLMAGFPLLVKKSPMGVKVAYWFVLMGHVFASDIVQDIWRAIRVHMDPVSVFFTVAALFYMLRRGLEQIKTHDVVRSFDMFFAAVALGGVLILDLWHSAFYGERHGYLIYGAHFIKYHAAFITAGAIAVMMIVDGLKPWIGRFVSTWIVGILCAGVAVVSILFPHALWGACFTILTLIGLAVMAARAGNLKTVNWLVGLMFLRIIVLYFHLFATLASLGVSLVGFGVIVLVAIGFWMRYKDRLVAFIRRA